MNCPCVRVCSSVRVCSNFISIYYICSCITAYNDRYENKPKLITSTGGDEFFMIDDAKYYYDELKGPKYLRSAYLYISTLRLQDFKKS